jgi:phage terminase small subunit
MRGRKPQPTKLKALEGNPGKRAMNDREPQPPAGVPDCPEFLQDEAREEWFRTAAVLKQMNLLTVADRWPPIAWRTDAGSRRNARCASTARS